MPDTPATGNDPADFDLDTWIDGIPIERTITLYPPNPDLAERARRLSEDLAVAERSEPSERGITEASPEVLRAQLAELQETWEASGMRVRIRELMPEEIKAAHQAADDAGVPDADRGMWVCSAACVQPPFTPDQLKRLGARGRAGDAMLAQLIAATVEQWIPPSIPFSSASSPTPGGDASSAS